MRYSNYFSVSSPIDEAGDRIIYSFVSNKLVKVSNAIALIIKSHSTDSLPLELVTHLTDMKVIIEEDFDELGAIVMENHNAIHNNKRSFNFTFFPSGNCQLGCHYCGQTHSHSKTSVDIQEAGLKYVEEQVPLKEYSEVHIAWFGGEPLLAIDVIKELTPALKRIAATNNLPYSARITTNGLLLNRQNFITLVENDIKQIAVSIDGPAEFHNSRRPTKGGNGSFDVIFTNLKNINNEFNFEELGIRFTIRMNVDKYNEPGVIPFLHMLKAEGFDKQKLEFDIAPIHSWGNDAHERSLEKSEWAGKKLEYLLELYELGFLKNFGLPPRKRIVCMAVQPDTRYMDHTGRLYDCSELPLVNGYNKDYSIGHIHEFNVTKSDKQRNFLNWNEEIYANKYPCGTCSILPICGGACPKAWKEGHLPCPDIKEYVNEYVALSYLTSIKSENILF